MLYFLGGCFVLFFLGGCFVLVFLRVGGKRTSMRPTCAPADDFLLLTPCIEREKPKGRWLGPLSPRLILPLASSIGSGVFSLFSRAPFLRHCWGFDFFFSLGLKGEIKKPCLSPRKRRHTLMGKGLTPAKPLRVRFVLRLASWLREAKEKNEGRLFGRSPYKDNLTSGFCFRCTFCDTFCEWPRESSTSDKVSFGGKADGPRCFNRIFPHCPLFSIKPTRTPTVGKKQVRRTGHAPIQRGVGS